MKSNGDPWRAVGAISGLTAALIIPLVVAFIGNRYTKAINEREIQGRFVELALTILRDPPAPEGKTLRTWALKIIDQYSGVPLTAEVRDDLATRLHLPSEATAAVAVAKVFPSVVSGQDFRGEFLVEPQFQGATIENCKFDRASLLRPHFSDSTLRNLSFVGALLPSADFRGAKFDHVDFSGTSLIAADFSEATGVESITWSPETQCPDGKPPNQAGCREHFIKYPWNR